MDSVTEREWKSPMIGKIAGALAKAQHSFGALVETNVVKNKDGTVRYKYADLSEVLAACRACLNTQEIAILQGPATPARNGIEVTTTLVHSSGEWLRSEPLFMPVSGGAQDVGSAITYARRYQLLAMVGLAPQDDDGAAAQAAAPKRWRDDASQAGQPGKAKAKPGRPPAERDLGPRCRGKAERIATAIDARMHELAELTGSTLGELWDDVTQACDVDYRTKYGPRTRPQDLTIEDGTAISAELATRIEAAKADPRGAP